MSFDKLSAGADVPDEINVIIEIPANSSPVKYEVDKDSGLLTVDRFMSAPMFYPCNYGYIPHTLAEDGDPIDVLVHTPYPLFAGCVIACRPIGVLAEHDRPPGPARRFQVETSDECRTPAGERHDVDASDVVHDGPSRISDIGRRVHGSIVRVEVRPVVEPFRHRRAADRSRWSGVGGQAERDSA